MILVLGLAILGLSAVNSWHGTLIPYLDGLRTPFWQGTAYEAAINNVLAWLGW